MTHGILPPSLPFPSHGSLRPRIVDGGFRFFLKSNIRCRRSESHAFQAHVPLSERGCSRDGRAMDIFSPRWSIGYRDWARRNGFSTPNRRARLLNLEIEHGARDIVRPLYNAYGVKMQDRQDGQMTSSLACAGPPPIPKPVAAVIGERRYGLTLFRLSPQIVTGACWQIHSDSYRRAWRRIAPHPPKQSVLPHRRHPAETERARYCR